MKPQRTCIVCKKKFDKDLLVRLAKDADGNISVGKNFGRGMYICKDQMCLRNLTAKKVLNKVFHKNIEPSVYEQVTNEVKNHE